jgi:hypothetical protein
LAAGDVLTFYKVAGPAWLGVAADGTLSGAPTTSDVGSDEFMLLVVDSQNLAGIGLLSISVNSPTNVVASPVILNITAAGGNVQLGWSGGAPPYQLQITTNPVTGWHNAGGPTSATNLIIAPASPQLFYRVQGQ